MRVPCGGSICSFPTNRHFHQIQFSSPSSNLEQERRHIQCSYQNYHVRYTDGFILLVGTNIHYWDIPNFCQKGQKNESTPPLRWGDSDGPRWVETWDVVFSSSCNPYWFGVLSRKIILNLKFDLKSTKSTSFFTLWNVGAVNISSQRVDPTEAFQSIMNCRKSTIPVFDNMISMRFGISFTLMANFRSFERGQPFLIDNFYDLQKSRKRKDWKGWFNGRLTTANKQKCNTSWSSSLLNNICHFSIWWKKLPLQHWKWVRGGVSNLFWSSAF